MEGLLRRATVGRDIETRVALGPGPDLPPGGGVAGLMRPAQLDGVELSHLDCLLSGVVLGRQRLRLPAGPLCLSQLLGIVAGWTRAPRQRFSSAA